MTWRQFTVLLRGLSGTSRWMTAARAAARNAPSRRITDVDEAERFFATIK